MNPPVAYATFCCPKDKDRVANSLFEHRASHDYLFAESFLIAQRCGGGDVDLSEHGFKIHTIHAEDYPKILGAFGIKFPDPVLDELTHGWDAAHYWAHHCVNHLKAAQLASSDFLVFSDGDCFMKEQPSDKTWIDEGICILKENKSVFAVSPNDGGPARFDKIMSQQMFLVERKKFLKMEFLPWDGTFIDGGPMQEYYGMLEGWIGRYLMKTDLWRLVLPPIYRWWHNQW